MGLLDDLLAGVLQGQGPGPGQSQPPPEVNQTQLSGLAQADYLQTANRFTLAVAMIETPEALLAADAILAVEGIDGGARIGRQREAVQVLAHEFLF